MEPLIADMVEEDPTKRPSNMDEVVKRFIEIKGRTSFGEAPFQDGSKQGDLACHRMANG